MTGPRLQVKSVIFFCKTITQVSGAFNDLWSYDLTTGLWTWLSGDKIVNQAGSYGMAGVPAVENVIASRLSHSMVLDGISIAIFVFGGYASRPIGNQSCAIHYSGF